jgi:hypothetical protein
MLGVYKEHAQDNFRNSTWKAFQGRSCGEPEKGRENLPFHRVSNMTMPEF